MCIKHEHKGVRQLKQNEQYEVKSKKWHPDGALYQLYGFKKLAHC